MLLLRAVKLSASCVLILLAHSNTALQPTYSVRSILTLGAGTLPFPFKRKYFRMVTLQEITSSNWHDICTLEVLPEQTPWVAPNSFSLVEAAYGFPGELVHFRLFPLAVYANEVPVG